MFNEEQHSEWQQVLAKSDTDDKNSIDLTPDLTILNWLWLSKLSWLLNVCNR